MRRVTLMVIPFLLVVALGALFITSWSDLPEPMAIHWGISGEPDGSFPRLATAGLLIVLFVAVWFAVYRSVRRSPHEASSFVAGLFAIGGLLVGAAWLMIQANEGRADWRAAGEFGLLRAVGLVVFAVVAGAIGWFAAGGRSVPQEVDPGSLPRLELAEPENAIWSGRGIGKPTTAIGVAIILAGLITWGWAGIGLVAVGIVALAFAAVRVTVSRNHLVVSLGWWGYPSWRVPIESVVSADVEKVNPMAYGGWGYRIRPGVRAVVIRSGDGIRITRRKGPDLIYTVDDAERGAGLVNAIVNASRE